MRLSPLRSISSFLFVAALALSCYDGLSGLGGFDCSNDNTCPAGYVCQGASGIPLVAFDASADAGEPPYPGECVPADAGSACTAFSGWTPAFCQGQNALENTLGSGGQSACLLLCIAQPTARACMYDVAEGYCSWCSSDVIVENDINDESIAGVFVSTCSVDGGHGKVDAPRRDTGVDVTTTKPACSPGCSDGSACQTASDCLSSRCENHVCAESLECGAQCGPGAVCPYEVPPQLNEGQSCLASCADGAEIVSASVVNATNCSPTECPEAAASCAGDESCTVVVDAATCGPDPCYGTNKGWSLTITCGEAGDAGFDAATDVEEPDDGGTCGAEGGGPCSCTELGACPPGQACAGGVCMPSADVCVYSSQCNADQVCDDGQCLAACSPEDPCAPGFNCSIFGVCQPTSTEACTSNGQCPFTAPVCAAGTCSLSCSADAECPTGDYCDLGACVPDTRPSPDCSTNSQCADDQICDAGFCLYMCETSTQCADIDERIPVCSQDVCRSTAEANPQCTTQSECAEGESCISNQCE